MKVAIGKVSFFYRDGFEKKRKELSIVTTEKGILNEVALGHAVASAISEFGINVNDVLDPVTVKGVIVDENEIEEVEDTGIPYSGITFETRH